MQYIEVNAEELIDDRKHDKKIHLILYIGKPKNY